MVTTATNTERVRARERERSIAVGPLGGSGSRGNGSRGNGGDGGGPRDNARSKDDSARLGMWVALASILMLFTALTSAYIVRAGMRSNDWRPIEMPRLLWLSTAFILTSSVTFEAARRALKRLEVKNYGRWIALTTSLGLGFLITQLLAWRQLVAQGVYLASNPHSSFFYVLTGAHAVHLLGGILGLGYLLLRTWDKLSAQEALLKRQSGAKVVGLYWHFMDGLWIYLFLLLFLWR